MALPSAERLHIYMERMASTPHVAGSPGSKAPHHPLRRRLARTAEMLGGGRVHLFDCADLLRGEHQIHPVGSALNHGDGTEKGHEEETGGNSDGQPLSADERRKRAEEKVEPGRTLLGLSAVYMLVRLENPPMKLVLQRS
jgi:hypothetical protein